MWARFYSSSSCPVADRGFRSRQQSLFHSSTPAATAPNKSHGHLEFISLCKQKPRPEGGEFEAKLLKLFLIRCLAFVSICKRFEEAGMICTLSLACGICHITFSQPDINFLSHFPYLHLDPYVFCDFLYSS